MRAIFVVAATLCAACTNARTESGQGTTSAAPQAAAEVVTGRVMEAGSDPGTWLALQPAGGGASLHLDGQVDGLRSVTGADIAVTGLKTSGAFQVESYTVLRVNDKQVDDGIVVASGDRVLLRLRAGAEREVPNAPPSLRALAGSRVWVSLPEPGVSPSFGVIGGSGK